MGLDTVEFAMAVQQHLYVGIPDEVASEPGTVGKRHQ